MAPFLGRFLVKMKVLVWVCVCVLVSVCEGGRERTGGAVWYVSAFGSDSNDGSTPQTAFKTLQKGVDASADGDKINGERTFAHSLSFQKFVYFPNYNKFTVQPGSYSGTSNVGLVITKAISIVSTSFPQFTCQSISPFAWTLSSSISVSSWKDKDLIRGKLKCTK